LLQLQYKLSLGYMIHYDLIF